jgi:sporulation protein YpjB
VRKWIFIVGSVVFLCVAMYTGWSLFDKRASYAKVPEQTLSIYQKMDRLSQEIYQLTKDGKYSEAKKNLAELGVLFSEMKPPKGLSIEAINAISDTIIKAKRAFAAVQAEPNRLLWHALQARLVIDSLTHEKQPLWKNYYNSYQEHINKMMLLTAGRKTAEFSRAFAQNLQLYQTLKPAITVYASSQQVEILYSIYSFLLQETRKAEYNWEAISNALEELNRLVDRLFVGEDRSTFAPGIPPESPILIIALFASIVLTSLGYVGWKKYKAEQHAKKRKQRDP